MAIYWITVFLIVPIVVSIFFFWLSNNCNLNNQEDKGCCIFFGVISLITFIVICIIGICYGCTEKTYERVIDTYQCYWINEQPYYMVDGNLFNIHKLIDKNVPSNTESINIISRVLDKDTKYYGFHPVDQTKHFVSIEFNKIKKIEK